MTGRRVLRGCLWAALGLAGLAGPGLAADAEYVEKRLAEARQAIYLGNYEEAVRQARDALEVDSGNETAMEILGSAYYFRADYRRAEEVWNRLLEVNPGNAAIRQFLKAIPRAGARKPSKRVRKTPPSSEIIQRLKSKDLMVYFAAAAELQYRGAAALPDLIVALRDPDKTIRLEVSRMLGEMVLFEEIPALDVVSGLSRVLRDPEMEVRRSAADSLGRIGTPSRQAVPELMRMLRAPDASVIFTVGSALESIVPGSAEAVPSLLDLLDEFEHTERSWAPRILARVGPAARAACPRLMKALAEDRSADVRSLSAEALGAIGASTAAVMPALLDALGDQDDAVRRNSMRALRRLEAKPAMVVPRLIPLINDKSAFVRGEAVRYLAAIGPKAKEAVPALILKMNADKDCPPGDTAVALMRIGTRDALAAVEACKR